MFDLAPAAPATTLPLFLPQAPPDKVSGLIHATTLLAQLLGQGRALDSRALRSAMETAFSGSDAEGAWVWKDAYEALEAAQVLFLRKFGMAMRSRAGSAAAMLEMLTRLAGRLASQTRRSEESEHFQQFSTPLALGFAAAQAAMLTSADLVLEPSAGTGMLAIFAELAIARLVLNEIAETRAGLLGRLFRDAAVTRHNAEQIHDRLDPAIRPSVVLMNPPFSASPHVEGRFAEATMRHVSSALARLAEGGRLVAITGHNVGPDQPAWRESFVRLQEKSRVVFTATIAGRAYVRHGTSIETRLTVIDRAPAENPRAFPPPSGMAADAAELLDRVSRLVPARMPVAAFLAPAMFPLRAAAAARPKTPAPQLNLIKRPAPMPDVVEISYETRDWSPDPSTRLTTCLYEGYALQTVHFPSAQPHPTKLVQSAAMAALAPPCPSYRPLLPPRLISSGILSDAQLESVVYAGEAHASHLAGVYTVDETFDLVSAAPADAQDAVRFRRGWFLGDGTGAGKGRQVAAIILDNWLKERRRAVWISKSDKLIQDAERDWTAVGGYRSDIVPLSRFRQGAAIALDEGILFTTYATLRTQARGEKASRVQQIIDWLGRDFHGVVVFDEAHAMANAAGDKSERGEKKPSQQGQAGLRLQNALHDARILYVSATGATTVQNLAYAARLGLWGTGDFPFATRANFVAAMEKGGVAAMEVLARDLKALGLYAARSLSFEGIEYEIVEHKLTAEQIRIYDAYANAFQIIHKNLNAALEAANITGSDGSTYNRNAKAAARSAFESNKQRFLNHLLTAMKCPTLIAAIARDLEDGHACILQIVSTNEALLDRRLAEIPTSEWADLTIDITPREYVLEYLSHSFPTQLFELYSDDEGNLLSRPAYDADGNPVISREAVERRDRMIEHLASLPPVQGALDQILHRFGTDLVAEVTGRSRRIVKRADRLCVETRAASANFAETAAFMDDDKRILVFSDAGGTGRSYHADLGCKNQRRRIHYPKSGSWVIAVRAESAEQEEMDTSLPAFSSHPVGEQPSVEDWSTTADTFAGRVRVEWDSDGLVTALGQLPFFIDYLKQAGLFAGWVADCPLTFSSPNAPSKRDLLGTVLLSVLSGHYRYAHITTLRCDAVNPRLLGMKKVVSEDAVRRGLAKIDEAAGLTWLQTHLDYCVRPLLSEPWVLDIDSTIKPLYGRQEGAVVGYNPHKPGRPSHCYHTYLMANLRLVLGVDVQPGDEHTPKHGQAGLWSLLHRLGRSRWPALLRGDVAWGVEPVMARAEQDGLAYLFRLRMTANVKRALTKMMADRDWTAAGHGWQGKETTLRLVGWSRQRRIVLLRRKLDRPLVILEHTQPEQPRLSFAEVGSDREVWEYAALVTSLDSEILTLGQLYRDRGDCENAFDELKNQWGWGGFTTHDLKRCRLLAGSVALIFNWWSLFVRLADLDHRPEAITSRPLLMQAIARQTQHAGQVTLTLSSTHGDQHKARRAYLRIAGFLARLRETAEQLNPVQRWYRILSEALKRYLKGRQLDPPPRLAPA